ncbi:MAG: histidine kinase [Ferruginibacter sp.]
MRQLIIFLAFTMWCLAGFSQTKLTDSLRKKIATDQASGEKIKDIFALSGAAINPDTLMPYLAEADKIAVRSGDDSLTDMVTYIRGTYYIRRNMTDSALYFIESLLSKYKKEPSLKHKYLDVLFFKSKALDRGNQLSKAITTLVEVIQEAEVQKDTLLQIQAKTGIGWVLMEMEQYKDALQWLFKALRTSSNKTHYRNYGALYSNIANAYNALGKEDSAMYYINIAITDARENESLGFLATALSMQAKIFVDHHKPKLAESPLNEVLQIRKQLNDPYYTVYDMSSLASYYANNNQPQKGIALCIEGIAIARQMRLQPQLMMIYRALAENYKVAGNTSAYSHTLEDIIALKDSFNNLNSARQIAELEARNASQKNEKTILEQKLNLTVKNYWLFGSAVFGVMAIVIFLLLFKNYRRKQQLKLQAALEEEKRMAAISIIEAEEQERRRIAADLHDNIGAYASAIRADVEMITLGNSDKKDRALQNLQQHSQEIMSSLRDTIWVLNKDHITVTGISDRIKNYTSKLQSSYSNILINLTEQIEDDKKLGSKQALNIFRIMQEAIHNALKHSNAKNIDISIHSRETLQIEIRDNGTGITAGAGSGNGLFNMKSRAAESGINLRVSTAENAGTGILLEWSTIN